MLADSTESSATSTGTIVLNQNALKPKNSQTHSVSQMSLQSTGISGCQLTGSAHKSPNSSKVLSSYSNKEQQSPSQQQQQTPQPQQHQLLQLPSNSPNSSSCSNSISSSASISTINTTNTTGIFLFSLSLSFSSPIYKLVYYLLSHHWLTQFVGGHLKIRCLENCSNSFPYFYYFLTS